jgi:predicted AlkP superfamily phosphohydrolase/phosphomutase
MPAKLLVIGLDGADATLLRQWSDAGDLPVLRALRTRGVSAALTSPPGFGDDATWASLYTGVSPAKHGRYFYSQLRPGTYELQRFADADLQRPPLWESLSRAGRRVAIIDVPKCPLAAELNGIQLVDWSVHGHDHVHVESCPPSLAAQVVAQFGAEPSNVCDRDLDGADNAFRDRLLASIDKKAALSAHYLDYGDWDLFLTVFKESHCIGHRCWQLLDRAHQQHDAAAVATLGNPIKQIYIALDAAVGRLLERAGAGTTVIVFSPLGMGANYTGEPLLDEILLRLDGPDAARPRQRIARLESLWRRVPFSIRQRAHHRLDWARRRAHYVATRRRRCFVLPHNEISGAIRVNLVGREPDGVIHPGAEYDAFCTALIRELRELVNLDTGTPVVQDVIRTSELYRGERGDRLPDLLVVWQRTAPIASAGSPKIGEVRRPYPLYRSGNHVPDGFLAASGPGVVPAGLSGPISVTDVAPTIAAFLGVPGDDYDGAPITTIRPTDRIHGG